MTSMTSIRIYSACAVTFCNKFVHRRGVITAFVDFRYIGATCWIYGKYVHHLTEK